MSKRIEQITQVVEAVKKELDDILKHPDDYISNEEARNILTNAFTTVANKNGITENSVRDKCTRQLDCDTDIFFNEVIDNLIGGRKLITRMKKYSTSDLDNDVIQNRM